MWIIILFLISAVERFGLYLLLQEFSFKMVKAYPTVSNDYLSAITKAKRKLRALIAGAYKKTIQKTKSGSFAQIYAIFLFLNFDTLT